MEILKEFLKKTGIGLKEFLKASLISALISFLVLLIGLKIAKVPYYGLVALAIAIVDLLPIVGSGIILIPWAIISYASSNPHLAMILILIFVITFLIAQLLLPLLLGKSIGIRPIFTMLITSISMIILSPTLGAIVGSIISIVLAVILDMRKARNSKS